MNNPEKPYTNPGQTTTGFFQIFESARIFDFFQSLIGANRSRKQLIEKFVRPKKDALILDIGCGSGAKFENISNKYIPYGIDISEESAREANEVFKIRGGEAVCAPSTEVLDRFGENKFSGAILRAYLEHEHDPFEVLKNLKYTLKNDAYAIIKVPNYGSLNRRVRGNKWCGFRFPDHVNQFTPKTLLTMISNANYEVVKFNFFD